jgi:hypothetical protein
MSKHTPDLSNISGYEITEDGHVYSNESNWRGYGRREMRQALNSHGYPSVVIYINGIRKHIVVHRLVAAKYLPPRPSIHHEVRHLDGNKNNNSFNNLAWGTRKENADDRERHGHTSRGLLHSIKIREGIYANR